jgi:hypothetical protein
MKPQCAARCYRSDFRYSWERPSGNFWLFLVTVSLVLFAGNGQSQAASPGCERLEAAKDACWRHCLVTHPRGGCASDGTFDRCSASYDACEARAFQAFMRKSGQTRSARPPAAEHVTTSSSPNRAASETTVGASARHSKSSGAHRAETVTRSEPPAQSREKRAPSTEVSDREPNRRTTRASPGSSDSIRGHGSMQPADLGDAVLEEWPAPSTGNSNPQNPCLNGPTSPGCVLGATPPPPQVVLTIRPPPPPPARPPVPPWWIDTLGNRLVGEQAGAQSLNDVIQQRIEQRDAEARQANDQGTTSLDDIVNKTKNCAPEEGPDGVVHRKWCPCPWFTDEEGNDVSHREARDFCGGPNSVCGIQPMYQNPNGYDMKDQARFGDCYDGCVKKINDYNALYDKECPKGGGRK